MKGAGKMFTLEEINIINTSIEIISDESAELRMDGQEGIISTELGYRVFGDEEICNEPASIKAEIAQILALRLQYDLAEAYCSDPCLELAMEIEMAGSVISKLTKMIEEEA